MTRPTLLLVFLVAICAAQAVDVSRVSEKFVERVRTFKLPRLESKISYDVLFSSLSNAVEKFINDIVIELYRQIRFQTYLMSNSILSTNDELYYEILYSKDNETNPFIDVLMEKMNRGLRSYLRLKPGLNHSLDVEFPVIPESKTIKSFMGYHHLSELFTNLETVVDTHLSNVNIVMDSFFKDGWQASRSTLKELKEEFRRDYLNGYLLQTYATVVSAVFENAEKIKLHATKPMWQTFEETGTIIKNLYEEIKPNIEDPFLRQRL